MGTDLTLELVCWVAGEIYGSRFPKIVSTTENVMSLRSKIAEEREFESSDLDLWAGEFDPENLDAGAMDLGQDKYMTLEDKIIKYFPKAAERKVHVLFDVLTRTSIARGFRS
jgi:hypothetical protein